MTVYSGRLDQFDTEESVLFLFTYILDFLNCTNAVLTFEDQTKAGLPCKPHYHFIFESEYERDYIRRFISEIPHWKGSNSSLKVCDDYQKGMIYILKQYSKQQYIPFSDLEEDKLNYYIELSKDYNNKIKLNNWSEHIDHFITISKFKENADRAVILKTLLGYIYDWNKDEANKRIDMPVSLKKTLNYIEEKVCSRREFIDRQMSDNGLYIYNEELNEGRRNRLMRAKPHLRTHFIDSDEEEL